MRVWVSGDRSGLEGNKGSKDTMYKTALVTREMREREVEGFCVPDMGPVERGCS